MPFKQSEPSSIQLRVGEVIYWAGCGLSTLFGIGGVWGLFFGSSERWLIFFFCLIPAFIVWLIGRAILYILNAR